MRWVQGLASEVGDPQRLGAVVRRAPVSMEALEVARQVDAPDWLFCAGAIRDIVWDAMHGRPLDGRPLDVDVGFFDPCDLTPDRDEAVERALRAGAPELPWEAKNQAAARLSGRNKCSSDPLSSLLSATNKSAPAADCARPGAGAEGKASAR